MTTPEEINEKKFDVHVVISSFNNERRTINFQEMTKEESQKIIETVNSAFAVIRVNTALLLTGSDGRIIFVNLENVAFIEVNIV